MPRSGVLNVSFAEKPPGLRGADSGRKGLTASHPSPPSLLRLLEEVQGTSETSSCVSSPRDLAAEGPAPVKHTGTETGASAAHFLPAYMVTAGLHAKVVLSLSLFSLYPSLPPRPAPCFCLSLSVSVFFSVSATHIYTHTLSHEKCLLAASCMSAQARPSLWRRKSSSTPRNVWKPLSLGWLGQTAPS